MKRLSSLVLVLVLNGCVSSPVTAIPPEIGPAVMIFRSVQQGGEPVSYESPVPVPLADHLTALEVIRDSGGEVRYADSSMGVGFLIPLCAQYCRAIARRALEFVRDRRMADANALVELGVSNGQRCVKKITYYKRSDDRWQTAAEANKQANSDTAANSQLAWCP